MTSRPEFTPINPNRVIRLCVFFLIVTTFAENARAQSAAAPVAKPPDAASTIDTTPKPSATPARISTLERGLFKNILRDQRAIFLSPFHLSGDDARWLVPLGGATAALIATDRRTSSALDGDESRLTAMSGRFSQIGSAYATGVVAAGFYVVGRVKHNRRARETGVLAGEALFDVGISTQAIKFATQRPRPNFDNNRGRFFTGGHAFPSGHSASAWAVATVIAYEYPERPLLRYTAYSLATVIGVSRYTGRSHFLSDTLIGSAIGYGVGRYVYRAHHIPTSTTLNDNTAAPTQPTHTKLFPLIAPHYEPHARNYGATLVWNF